jgi:hypothetical protein
MALLVYVAERSLRLHCDDPLLESYLRLVWRPLAAKTQSAAELECEDVAIVWDGERIRVDVAGRELVVKHLLGDRQDAALCAQAALLAHAFRRLANHRALYAAGFATERGALAVIAPSGAGKTTLLLELARRGRKIFGDEYLLLDRESFTARPFPLDFVARAPTLVLLADARLSGAARTLDGGPAHAAIPGRRLLLDVAEVFGANVWAQPAPLAGVVFLHPAGSAGPRLESFSSAAAALEMLPHFFIDSLAMCDVWETIGKIAPLRCHRLFAADHLSAANALEALAGGSSWTSTPKI